MKEKKELENVTIFFSTHTHTRESLCVGAGEFLIVSFPHDDDGWKKEEKS